MYQIQLRSCSEKGRKYPWFNQPNAQFSSLDSAMMAVSEGMDCGEYIPDFVRIVPCVGNYPIDSIVVTFTLK
jgi:hypothetical protein